ncbi:MAG: class I SAM-dependent methyltransferase [Planctomycetaceae bacterium]
MDSPDEADVLQRLRQTPEIFARLNTHSGGELAIQRQLRSDYSGELVTAAIGIHEARRKAAGKLPEAEHLWLTRVGLEQSTAWQVAQHKAARFPQDERILDLCCGVGVDTAALLTRSPVLAIDLNPAMALRCRWNNELWNAELASRLVTTVEDVHAVELAGTLLHIDPDRRCGRDSAAKRLEQYSPDLAWMQHTVQVAAGGALKLGPASNFMQKFPGCEIELISLSGECKEATVWFGSLAGKFAFRATHLPSGETLSADPLSAWCREAHSACEYILDPDPALVRSGLIDVCAEMHRMQRLDKEDEYLTADRLPDTRFVTAYRIEAALPNNLREIKRYLRSHPGGHYEVKCRRLSVDANAIQKKLPKGDGPPRVLFFIRHGGKAVVVVSQRVKKTGEHGESNIDDARFRS